MEHSNVFTYLTYEERKLCLLDICKYYNYSNKRKSNILRTWGDDRLLAYRASIIERGLIMGYAPSSIHMNAILNMFGGNKYYVDECNSITRFHLGLKTNDKDKFGFIKQYEIGYLDIDRDWKIKEFEMWGIKAKRFHGLQLIIDGKK